MEYVRLLTGIVQREHLRIMRAPDLGPGAVLDLVAVLLHRVQSQWEDLLILSQMGVP